MNKLKREETPDKRWLMRYNLLKEFIEGTKKYPSFKTTLGIWVANQRLSYRKGTLSLYKIKSLKEINFMFSIDEKWNEKLEALKLHIEQTKETSKDGKVIIYFPSANNSSLGYWCNHQRQQFKKEKLPQWKIEALNNIGFVWHYR